MPGDEAREPLNGQSHLDEALGRLGGPEIPGAERPYELAPRRPHETTSDTSGQIDVIARAGAVSMRRWWHDEGADEDVCLLEEGMTPAAARRLALQLVDAALAAEMQMPRFPA